MYRNNYLTGRRPFLVISVFVLVILISGIPGKTHPKKDTGSEDWKLHKTQAFNIYYSGDDQPLAEKAGDILEEEFDKITELLGFMPSRKSDIYLVPEGKPEELKIRKSIKYGIIIDYSDNFKNALIREFTGIVLYEMYGKKGMRALDPWFYKGIIAYVSDTDSTWDQMDQQYLAPEVLESLEGKEAMEVGKYIWKYLVKMNGESVVAYVLNSARILEDEIPSVEQVTGVPFEHLLNSCKKYYF